MLHVITRELRCIQADGQRKELQRITLDNKRLYRSLQVRLVLPLFFCFFTTKVWFNISQEIKPTVPSLKQIKVREKDLNRCVPVFGIVCQLIAGSIVAL